MYTITGSDATLTASTQPTETPSWVRQIHAPLYWRRGYTGGSTVIAVTDTGGDLLHPYLRPNILAAHSAVPHEGVFDGHGHGTHVAGLVKQVAPDVKLLIVKGIADNGSGNEEWLAESVRWSVAHGAHIINASWGMETEPSPDGPLYRAVADAVAAGVVFVAAAGNSGHKQLEMNTVIWPARWQEPLAVAATWQMVPSLDYSLPAGYSSAGPEVDVAAPGTWLRSCAPGGGWVELSGTSMATPVVCGLLALMRDEYIARQGYDPTEPELVTLIKHSTRDIPPAGRDALAGVGEVDLCPLATRRIVTVTSGSANIHALDTRTLAETNRATDVAARIEPPGRFVTEFRGLAETLGATVTWDEARQAGIADIEVVE